MPENRKILAAERPNLHAEEVTRHMEGFDIHATFAQARLIAARSFVVKLCRHEVPTAAKAIGRVENVATGESAYFYSMPELEEFMRRTSSDCR